MRNGLRRLTFTISSPLEHRYDDNWRLSIALAIYHSSYNDMTSTKLGIDSKFRMAEQRSHGTEAKRPVLPRGRNKDSICTEQRARTKNATWASECRGLRYEV
jgi:hypothetical protein